MKQIIQNLKTGETLIEEIPVPKVNRGSVLIKTHKSLVSLGTEKMLVEFGKANYIEKARQQPEKVKQVIQKIKTDGLKPTVEAVFRKLDQPLPLGYCNAGEVIAIGEGVKEFKIGDRVVSNGAHAEVVNIPENLVAKIPDDVSYEDAVFTVVGAIGLQGIRLIKPNIGETVVVIGLGLIGLISIQILKANGCNVIGFDQDLEKVNIARKLGITSFNASDNNSIRLVNEKTDNIGADAILITASSKSNEIISQAAKMCRKKGKIILVGVIGLNIQRSDMYEKEITFQVSCSYGPGRYDSNYEQKGLDYPIGYVRWTEKRNFEAVLYLLDQKLIDVGSLITESIDFKDYNKIYSNISNNNSIASILNYNPEKQTITNKVKIYNNVLDAETPILGIIGAGNYTSSTLLPKLYKLDAQIKYISSSNGLSGTLLAKKYKISNSITDNDIVSEDTNLTGVIVTTRHDRHAKDVIKFLNSNKHVFVEKPLALNIDELNSILKTYKNCNSTLTVGFNRRFSPLAIEAKNQISDSTIPINVIATMNAGFIPNEHWVHDMQIGGGRVIGEACHYIDLISFFTQSKITSVVMNSIGKNPNIGTDNASILLKYENGSQGVINYFSNGSKSYPKERIEIFDSNKNIVIDNFKKLSFYGYSRRNLSITQDKGHSNILKEWIKMIKNGTDPIIDIESILNTTKASILCLDSLKNNCWIDVE